MIFQQVKDALINQILGPAEAGRYITVGYQRQIKSLAGDTKLVQAYYAGGTFPRGAGRITGPVQHDMTFRLDLTVTASAQGDLATLNNPLATPPEKAAALLALQEAAARADIAMDALVDIVYQVLMDARNVDLQLPVGTISNRWIENFDKNDPVTEGEYVILTGAMQLKCRAEEAVPGDSGTPGEKVYDMDIDLEGDDVEKTGKAGIMGG